MFLAFVLLGFVDPVVTHVSIDCGRLFPYWPHEYHVINLLDECGLDPEIYFPEVGSEEWETVAPSDLGWDVDAIPDLLQFLEEHETRAFLLTIHGRLVLEYYWGENLSGQPFNKDSWWYWASAGKTLTATLVGVTQWEGLLSLEDASSDYLGSGWTSLNTNQEDAITVWHQLTMTTGLDDGVGDPNCTDPECLIYLAEPGSRWAYHNAAYTKLYDVVEQATGSRFTAYFNSRIRDPIGMDGQWYDSEYNHVYYSKPRSMMRFGLLILNEGRWEAGPFLLDPAFYEEMVHTSQSLNESYGYLWWLNGKSSYMLPGLQDVFSGMICPHAPDDMIAAMGKNGQLINVVPGLGLVMVRMGSQPTPSVTSAVFQDQLWEKLNPVLSISN